MTDHRRPRRRGQGEVEVQVLSALLARPSADATPFPRPLRTAVSYTTERWADEEATRAVGDRRTEARAIGRGP
jgi:hypothetical protein